MCRQRRVGWARRQQQLVRPAANAMGLAARHSRGVAARHEGTGPRWSDKNISMRGGVRVKQGELQWSEGSGA